MKIILKQIDVKDAVDKPEVLIVEFIVALLVIEADVEFVKDGVLVTEDAALWEACPNNCVQVAGQIGAMLLILTVGDGCIEITCESVFKQEPFETCN
jgi:hypothetical protein